MPDQKSLTLLANENLLLDWPQCSFGYYVIVNFVIFFSVQFIISIDDFLEIMHSKNLNFPIKRA